MLNLMFECEYDQLRMSGWSDSEMGIPQFWCLPFSIPYRIRLYGRFGPYRLSSVAVRASKKYLRLRLRHPRICTADTRYGTACTPSF